MTFRSTIPSGEEVDDNNTSTTLTLSLSTRVPPPPLPPPAPLAPLSQSNSRKRKRNISTIEEKNEIIPVPYPWATNRRAKIHNVTDLKSMEIDVISGEVQCKSCQDKYEMKFNLEDKLNEVLGWFVKNIEYLHHRAPEKWRNPVLPNCEKCGQENRVKPIINFEEMEKVNWLFLVLGEMIGVCTIKQLKFFCMHNNIHRTGAKDRLVYLTYQTLFKQLFPDQSF